MLSQLINHPSAATTDVPFDDDEKVRVRGEVHRLIAPRDQKYQSNFVEVCYPAFALLLLLLVASEAEGACVVVLQHLAICSSHYQALQHQPITTAPNSD